MILAVCLLPPLIALGIISTVYACKSLINEGKTMKDKNIYYVVESSKNTYVFRDKDKAVEKQGALLLTLREPISIQVMEQMSIDEYILLSKKKVTIYG